MGGGSWDTKSYASYTKSVGRTMLNDGSVSGQNLFTSRNLDEALNPYKVIRECCDSEEHPNTIPVILALDVTGSMGSACKKVAQSLNVIMTDLYKKYKDIEFMIMGIGDLAYDHAPIQASQFESDIRIAEQTDKIYFEGHGGGNDYESYTSAWYFGLNKCKLDCWKRGKKGIIITMGDEALNPYLPTVGLRTSLGDHIQGDVETPELYKKATEKYDIYHIAVDDSDTCYSHNKHQIEDTWLPLLGENYKVANLNSLPSVISSCIAQSVSNGESFISGSQQLNENTEIMPVIGW